MEKQQIVRSCHVDPTSGHLGVHKTTARISERFHWIGIVRTVKDMVKGFFTLFS